MALAGPTRESRITHPIAVVVRSQTAGLTVHGAQTSCLFASSAVVRGQASKMPVESEQQWLSRRFAFDSATAGFSLVRKPS